MAETGSDLNPLGTLLREWAPVSDLLNKLPTRAQSGLFHYEIILTCVDVLPEFIAVGTNLGLVYWFDRKKKDLQKLRCENPNGRITTVKIISTVDYMVACGNGEGQITIFQIPKTHPETIPERLKPKSRQVERYTVSGLHSAAITTLEWSKNGMKLFSGDQNGLVVLTEIDFYMHLSKSVDILNEAYEVVQLSYSHQHLLISTIYRTIICKKEDKWIVCQVGKKDRKSLGKLGAFFWKNSLNPKDLQVYCTRPGLRIWISDLQGTVQKTLLFKDLLNKECIEVPLINPISGYAKKLKPIKEASFGIILPFDENLLVTYNSDVIYILDPVNLLVVATVSHLRRILSVAVHKDEIFILEGERSLIRISSKPETVNLGANLSPIATNLLPIANSLKDISNKIQNSSIISALPPLFDATLADLNIQVDSTSIINAEEAMELPPVKKIDLKLTPQFHRPGIPSGLECKETKKWEVFDKIGEEEFDDHILFKHRRRKNRKHKPETEMQKSITSLSSNSSEELDGSLTKPCLLDISTVDTLVPDLRSPDSILHDIENKEKILADLLNLDKIQLSIDEPSETQNNINFNAIPDYIFSNHLNNVEQQPETKPLESNLPSMSYGPPSGSSNPNSIDPPACLVVPPIWKLQEITINQDVNDTSDNSLCDWEFI